MFKNLLLVLALLFVLISASKADLPDTVWCKYTYPTQINAVKFTPDGKYLLTGGSDGIPRLWDVATGALVKQYPYQNFIIFDIAINENIIAFTGVLDIGKRGTNVYNLLNDSLMFSINEGSASVKFSNDGNFMISCHGSGVDIDGITIFDTKFWKKIKTINLAPGSDRLDLSPDNKYIAVAKNWNMNIKDSIASVLIYNFPDLTYFKTLITRSYLSINQLVFSDVNQNLACALGSDGDKIWNTSDWGLFRNINLGSDSRAIAFSPDNKFVVAGFTIGGKDWDRLFIIDLLTNKTTFSYLLNWFSYLFGQVAGDTPLSISISPNSKFIAVSGGVGIYMLNAKWNPASVANNLIQIINPIIFPNPTNGTANIQFSLLKPELINIKIYDSASNLVSSVFNGQLQQGMQNIPWNALSVASGVYYARITAAGQVSTIQIIVNK
ncbi:MAG: T9SS type A sorting domain-containing protein [Candidatus Kapabacteria bacterium]|nr:T9SS type A sorting domain-containing protein [Candidatus Kapabacteria bacterium]